VIFNAEKTVEEYESTPIFMGPKPGLFDTIYKKHPKIWSLYKEMKSLDWSEDEFDYTQCNLDFKNCDPQMAEMMIRTLAWQWEADSVASRSMISVMAPFITSSEAWAAMQRISDNEVVHAATYSEIVRMSFDNPKEVLANILAVKESLGRLSILEETLDTCYDVSISYAARAAPKSYETYRDGPFKAMVALLFLERVQFPNSFAITFTICSTGLFQPIGKAVQKICQDELEVHSEFDFEVLRNEFQTSWGARALEELKPFIAGLARAFIKREYDWLAYLFAGGRSLVGTTEGLQQQWVLFNATPVVDFFGVRELLPEYSFPTGNPLPNMEKWIDMNKTQAAPQEQDIAAYKVGVVVNDDENAEFDLDF
jgi:ribonucleoside-diphosphate reductase beta chain